MRQVLHIPRGHDGAVWPYHVPGVPWSAHRHRELELNLVTAGHAQVLVAGRRYRLEPGTLVWLFPEQDHVLFDASPDFQMWIAVFRPALLRRACRDRLTRPLLAEASDAHLCRRLPMAPRMVLQGMIERLAGQGDEPAVFNSGLGYLLTWAWSVFHRQAPGSLGLAVHPAVLEAARLLRSGAADATVAELAAACGLSAGRLSHLFRLQTGVSLSGFRNTCRLERFLQACQEGDTQRHTLLRLALEAGFGSYAQFHRVFIAHMGMSPRQYFGVERA